MSAQGTEQWRKDRMGTFSGSKIYNLCVPKLERKADSTLKADVFKWLKSKCPDKLQNLADKHGKEIDKLTLSEVDFLYKSTPGDMAFSSDLRKGQLSYIRAKATEILNPTPEKDLLTDEVLWGETHEPAMFKVVEDLIGVPLETPPFMMSPCGNFGSSPDRVCHEKRLVFEGKCPFVPSNFTKASMYTLEEFKRDHPDYYYQCQAHIAVTGGYECFFVNYDPRISNPKRRLSILHVPEDEAVQEELTYWAAEGEKLKQEFIRGFLTLKDDAEKLLQYAK